MIGQDILDSLCLPQKNAVGRNITAQRYGYFTALNKDAITPIAIASFRVTSRILNVLMQS